MEHFFAAYHTDAGIRRKINQDSVLLKAVSKNNNAELILAVICDGMGGMEKGELASATVVKAFAKWMDETFLRAGSDWDEKQFKAQWRNVLIHENEKLVCYGRQQGIRLGTTVTAVLVNSNGRYLWVHVGDSRAYLLSEEMVQLTKDHSFIVREIEQGRMTPEQAKKDPRRNALLQCIGLSEKFEPQYGEGHLENGSGLLLCSDGFRHVVADAEILSVLNQVSVLTDENFRGALVELVECNKKRGETDNISVVYLRLR